LTDDPSKPERPIDENLLRRLLSVVGDDAILVGGQSLAVWAHFFGIEPKGVLAPFVTADADFLGDRAVARAIAEKLGGRLFVPTADDHVAVSAAVVTFPTKDGGYVRADFLASVAGMDTQKIRDRATPVEAWGSGILVMHPVDCLQSRLANLRLLPEKRNAVGVAQAKLAIRILRATIERYLKEGHGRFALELAERVGDLARTKEVASVQKEYGIDPLKAIPLQAMPGEFKEKQWPRIQARTQRRLAKTTPAGRSRNIVTIHKR